MDVSKAIIYLMFSGACLMCGSIALMLLSFVIDSFTGHRVWNRFALGVSRFASRYLLAGLAIFLCGFCLLVLNILINGISAGEYVLAFSRSSSGETVISWARNPLRFLFQTLLFGACFVGLLYVMMKTVMAFKAQFGQS
jgi:hypothetical protein